VTSATHSGVLPNVPTVGDFVPGYEVSAWFDVGAPKNTPTEIIEKLNKEINAALDDPKLKARLADLGAEPMLMTPTAFGKLITDDTEKWGKSGLQTSNQNDSPTRCRLMAEAPQWSRRGRTQLTSA
jgi:tripartite-type tricarboxylate transporter receptor subunit TctC